MINILFVCHGNICRSPMAEFVMKERVRQAGLNAAVYVESAAMHRDEIGSDVHYGTKEILDRYGIPYEHRAARLATTADYDKFDYIVGMDRYNMRDMMSLYHNDPDGKLSLLMDWVGASRDVADPWYTGDFDTTYEDVDAGCLALVEHLKRIVSSGRNLFGIKSEGETKMDAFAKQIEEEYAAKRRAEKETPSQSKNIHTEE